MGFIREVWRDGIRDREKDSRVLCELELVVGIDGERDPRVR